MSAKETVFNDRKNKCEEIYRFRNGDITQYLTSVDIETIVRSGGYIVNFLESFSCDDLVFNPFERFFVNMTENETNLRKKKNVINNTNQKLLYLSLSFLHKKGHWRIL